MPSIKVKGSLVSRSTFEVHIKATETAIQKGLTSKAVVWTSEITRYFNPYTYEDLGFEDYVSVSNDISVLNDESTLVFSKRISKLEISYYPTAWLDTSAISLLDFGHQFEDYKVAHQ